MGQRASWDTETDPAAQWDGFLHRADRFLANAEPGFVSENSAQFHGSMINTMMVSYYKYGELAKGYPERVNAVGTQGSVEKAAVQLVDTDQQAVERVFAGLGSLGKRLRWYFFGERNLDYAPGGDEPEFHIIPGNTEYLVDVANFAMIEFMHPAHPGAHYRSTDSSGSPGRAAHNDLYEQKGITLKNTDIVGADEEVVL